MKHNQSLKELQKKVAHLEDELAAKNEALRALKESDENFRLLAEHTNDAIFIIDTDQQLTYINPAATHLYGFTIEELKQIPFDQRYTPESVQRIWEAVKKHRQHLELGETDRTPFALELQHYHKNGGLVDLETIVSPVYEADGTYRCAAGIARDIRKRKKWSEAFIFIRLQ